jgi:hypothetical protein
VNFPSICSNIPAALAYGVYLSQLIRDSRVFCSYHDFLEVAANKEANEPRVTSDQVDVMTLLAIKEYLCHIIMTTNMFRLS